MRKRARKRKKGKGWEKERGEETHFNAEKGFFIVSSQYDVMWQDRIVTLRSWLDVVTKFTAEILDSVNK